MKSYVLSIAFVFGLALPVFAAEKVQPVRMGCGIMTFDTVPGWGLGEDGKSVLGSTHGGVVVDKAGSVYNLLRWVSQRTIKENFIPVGDYRYPYMGES